MADYQAYGCSTMPDGRARSCRDRRIRSRTRSSKLSAITDGIAPALRRSGDCNARRTVGRPQPRLGRRRRARRERVAGIFRRRERRSRESSHTGRSIRRTLLAGCACCCARLPGACFDRFSMSRFSILGFGYLNNVPWCWRLSWHCELSFPYCALIRSGPSAPPKNGPRPPPARQIWALSCWSIFAVFGPALLSDACANPASFRGRPRAQHLSSRPRCPIHFYCARAIGAGRCCPQRCTARLARNCWRAWSAAMS